MRIGDTVLIRATVFDTPDPEADAPVDRFYVFEIDRGSSGVGSPCDQTEMVSIYEHGIENVVVDAQRLAAEEMPSGSIVATCSRVWIKRDNGCPPGIPFHETWWIEAVTYAVQVDDDDINGMLRSGEAAVLRVGDGTVAAR